MFEIAVLGIDVSYPCCKHFSRKERVQISRAAILGGSHGRLCEINASNLRSSAVRRRDICTRADQAGREMG